MRRIKFLSVLVLLALLLSTVPGAVLAQDPPPVSSLVGRPTPPQPEGFWGTAYAYRWEYVNGGHWLAVWRLWWCYDPHFVPGDWQTCGSGYGCISSWTWWLQYPESKLGVPSHWRSIWPGADEISNYIATGYLNQ